MNFRAKNRSSEFDDAVWFLFYSLLESIKNLVFNNSLHGMCDESPELGQLRLQQDRLALMFATLRESVAKALKSVLTQSTLLETTEIDED